MSDSVEHDPPQDEEVPLVGAALADRRLVRVGDTVRRPGGHWTASVQHLLGHLHGEGFDAVPEPLGLDDRGREVLRFLPGRDQGFPFHEDVLSIAGAEELGRFAGRLQQALAAYDCPADAEWQFATGPPGPGEAIQHGDLGPWNLLWGAGPNVVGLLDWDFAGPADASYDLGHLAWFTVPLMDDERARARGFPRPPDRLARLAAFAAGCGSTEEAVLEAGLAAQTAYARMVVGRGQSPRPGQWATLYELRFHELALADHRWACEHVT
jgi:hypothetical protein